MDKNLITPEKNEDSLESTSFTINLAIIASYTVIAMSLLSFLQPKTSFFSNKTPKNPIISSREISQTPYDQVISSEND